MALDTVKNTISATSSLAIETSFADGWQAGTGAFYFGEMTTIQRDMWLTNAKASLRNGATIFNTTAQGLQTWDTENGWQSLSGNSSSNLVAIDTDFISDGDLLMFVGDQAVDGKYEVTASLMHFAVDDEVNENDPNAGSTGLLRFGGTGIGSGLDSVSFYVNTDTALTFARNDDNLNTIFSGGTVVSPTSTSPSAFLEIQGVGALLLSRITTEEMEELPTPIEAMFGFNTTTKKFIGYNGAEWAEFSTNSALTVLEKLPAETAAAYHTRAVAYEADEDHRYNGSVYMVLPYGVGVAAQNGFLRIFTSYEVDPAAPAPVTVSGWRSVPVGAISTLPAAE